LSETTGDGARRVRASHVALARTALRPPLKRAIDVAGAAALLLSLSPAFVLVFLLVRADGGPAFVSRHRVGRGGHEFGLLAFRVPEAKTGSASSGSVDLGAADEERLTRLGRALRWTALDELPRLLNVLRGDMSLVGPRPVAREDLERSYALFGGAAAYLSVRPGLVGPCEARGGCGGALGARERVALDAAYAQHPSLRADLAILARTAGVLLRRPEAR